MKGSGTTRTARTARTAREGVRSAVAAAAVLVALGATGSRAAAQQPAWAHVDLGLLVAQPVGEFDRYVDTGWGVGGALRLKPSAASPLSLRVDLGFVNYGRERKPVCFGGGVGCRVELDLTTSNNIFAGSIGPELELPVGPIRPYANAGVGLAYFATESSVEGSTGSQEPFARTTNYDDGSFAWSAGGGVRIPFHTRRTPIALDIGARYLDNGRVSYLTEGAIEDQPDGSLILHPTRSEANLVVYRIGVSIGLVGSQPRR